MPKAQTKATAPTPTPDTPLPVEYAGRIYPVKDSKYTLANDNVDINGVFAIRGVKVIRGEKGPFVAMPPIRVKLITPFTFFLSCNIKLYKCS